MEWRNITRYSINEAAAFAFIFKVAKSQPKKGHSLRILFFRIAKWFGVVGEGNDFFTY